MKPKELFDRLVKRDGYVMYNNQGIIAFDEKGNYIAEGGKPTGTALVRLLNMGEIMMLLIDHEQIVNGEEWQGSMRVNNQTYPAIGIQMQITDEILFEINYILQMSGGGEPISTDYIGGYALMVQPAAEGVLLPYKQNFKIEVEVGEAYYESSMVNNTLMMHAVQPDLYNNPNRMVFMTNVVNITDMPNDIIVADIDESIAFTPQFTNGYKLNAANMPITPWVPYSSEIELFKGYYVFDMNVTINEVVNREVNIGLQSSSFPEGSMNVKFENYNPKYTQFLTFKNLTSSPNMLSFSQTVNKVGWWDTANRQWVELSNPLTDTVTIPANGEVMLKAESEDIHFSSTGDFRVEGNLQTVKLADFWQSTSSLSMYGMFKNNTYLKSADLNFGLGKIENMVSMFEGCTGLIQINNDFVQPDEYNTIPVSACKAMFKGCTSLTNGLDFSDAWQLNDYACEEMYSGCVSLTAMPPLGGDHYIYMYNQPCKSMFEDCINLTSTQEEIFVELSSITGTQQLANMFRGCTSLVTAPKVRLVYAAPTGAMDGMFADCTSLTSAGLLGVTSAPTTSMNNWLSGVAASGTITVKAGCDITMNSASGVPSGWSKVEYY